MAKTQEIKTNIIDGAFEDKPHIFYLVYDEITDELIIRLVKPDTIAVVFDTQGNDNIGLLLEPQTNEIVGFNLYNFQSVHLPHWDLLKNIWYKQDLPKHFSSYKTIKYDPKEHARHHHSTKQFPDNWPKQFVKSRPILEEALV